MSERNEREVVMEDHPWNWYTEDMRELVTGIRGAMDRYGEVKYSIKVMAEAWHHRGEERVAEEVKWVVSVLPGLDGSKGEFDCTQLHFGTIFDVCDFWEWLERGVGDDE